MIKDYVLPGFKTPSGIDSTDKVMNVQRKLGVKDDGMWGPQTQAAYDNALKNGTDPQIRSLLVPTDIFSNRNGSSRIALEKMIETIPGITVSRLAFDASSQDKLYNIIDSSRLSDALKNRAKYVVGALDQGRQDVLLLDVMLDGVDAYFSREALDQGAYSLAAGDTKRLYENAVLPGEGPARRVLEARLNSGALGRNAGNAFAGAVANTATNTMAGTGGVLNAEAQRTGNALMLTAAKSVPADMAEVEEKRDKYNNLVWELQALENRISRISIWEKIPFFYSERYQDALARKGELHDGIARLETELDKLYPKWDTVLDIPSAGQPTATLQPTPVPTPKPTPSPTPMPMPTPALSVRPTASADSTLSYPEQQSKEKVDAIIQAAKDKLGMKYNDMKCNELAYNAYAAAGIDIKGTAARQAELCTKNGWFISKENLQAGDLIFWQRTNCSEPNCHRWNEIHHVGIYIGNGKIIDSSTSKDAVVERDIWEGAGYVIYGYARPHSQ